MVNLQAGLFGHRAGKAGHPLQSLEGLLGSGNPRLGYNLKVPLELCHYPFVFGRPLREEILNLFDLVNHASVPPHSLLSYVEGLPLASSEHTLLARESPRRKRELTQVIRRLTTAEKSKS